MDTSTNADVGRPAAVRTARDLAAAWTARDLVTALALISDCVFASPAPDGAR